MHLEWIEQANALLDALGPLDPLGAVAMREAAALVVDACNDLKAFLDYDAISAAPRIRALPAPDHAASLAAALTLPEVVEMQAELLYLHVYGSLGAVWWANESKDVWRQKAQAALPNGGDGK